MGYWSPIPYIVQGTLTHQVPGYRSHSRHSLAFGTTGKRGTFPWANNSLQHCKDADCYWHLSFSSCHRFLGRCGKCLAIMCIVIHPRELFGHMYLHKRAHIPCPRGPMLGAINTTKLLSLSPLTGLPGGSLTLLEMPILCLILPCCLLPCDIPTAS